VIIDWVANHTAFDNPWTQEHSDWYLKNDKGEIYPVTYTDGAEPEYWTDVTGFDYRNPGLWKGMTDAMLYWVREADIDGFRCDVAGKVPTPFWNQARAALDRVKPVFMLAEADKPELHEHAFDMTYGWDTKDLFKAVAKGKADARTLADFALHPPKAFPPGAYRMRFTSNHDENSWAGSDVELKNQLEFYNGRCAGGVPPESTQAADTAKPPPPASASREAYGIQVGAVTSQAAADKLLASLKSAGLQGYSVKDGTLLKVRAGPYPDRDKALAAIPKVRGAVGGSPFVVKEQ